MCRLAPSGSPGSPALPARPASPSCWPIAPRSSSTAAITVQARDEVDAAAFTIEHLVEHPPTAWIEANLPAGAKLGYSPWLHTVDGAERLAKACEAAGGSLVAVADNPIDACWQRPAAAAARRGGAARSALCRRGRDGEARARPRRHAETQSRCAGGVRSASGLLAVQHPRQRCAAHAGGARLCAGAEGGPPVALYRRPQARQRRPASPRRTGRDPRPGRFRARSCRARQSASRGAARSGRLSGGDRAACDRERRQGACAAAIRSRR